MSEQKYSVLKLRLSLNLEETDVKDRVVLNRYGKVKQGIIREVLVPADITLHALHYVIQRAFGWQNSHLHQYLLPEEVFQKMTGGKNRPDEYGRTLYDGKLTDWIDLCGVYFRFPCDDLKISIGMMIISKESASRHGFARNIQHLIPTVVSGNIMHLQMLQQKV